MDSFEDLECYKFAREVRRGVSKFCKTLPADERFRLVDQMIRSSRSVTANIAEAHGRHHFQETLHFLRHARGSLYETKEHYHTALDEEFISQPEHQVATDQIVTTLKLLNGFIRYMKSRLAND